MTESERAALREQIKAQALQIEEARLRVLALSSVRFNADVGSPDVRDLRLRYEAARRDPNFREAWMDKWDEHREAAERFHNLRAEVANSNTWPSPDKIRKGDRYEIDRSITFLEANPMCFRSGYLKEKVLRALKRVDLSDEDLVRLAQVIIGAVCDPWRPPDRPKFWNSQRFGPRPRIPTSERPRHQRREFRWYARLARKLPTIPLRGRLLELHAEGDRFVAHRADLVLGLMSRERPPLDSESAKSSSGGPYQS